MPTIAEEKKRLRKAIKELKVHLTASEKLQAEQRVLDGLLAINQVNKSRKIAIYNSLADELPTKNIIKALIGLGHDIYLPVISGEDIIFRQYISDDSLEVESTFGIKEPKHGKLLNIKETFTIIVPGIAFTQTGNRLGRGGGYYDRFLNSCKNNGIYPYKIGIAFECQKVKSIPIDSFDIPMDSVLFG